MMHELIQANFENRVKSALGKIHVKLPNVLYKPTPGVPWARVTYLPARTESVSLGTTIVEYKGLIQVDVFMPSDSGPGAADQYISKIEDEFPIGSGALVGGCSLQIISTSRMPSIEEPMWYNVPIAVFWRLLNQT